MEIKDKFLPIGSVVILKGGTKKVMITGFCSIAETDKTQVYDYSGCIYPEGYLSSNQICLFNHDQIEKLFFLGYENDEESEFKKSLASVVEKFKDGTITLSDEDFDENIEIDDVDEDTLEDDNSTIGDLEYL